MLLVYIHPGGYGGISHPFPGSKVEVFLDPPGQCIRAEGLGHVLCTAWRNDNTGGLWSGLWGGGLDDEGGRMGAALMLAVVWLCCCHLSSVRPIM